MSLRLERTRLQSDQNPDKHSSGIARLTCADANIGVIPPKPLVACVSTNNSRRGQDLGGEAWFWSLVDSG